MSGSPVDDRLAFPPRSTATRDREERPPMTRLRLPTMGFFTGALIALAWQPSASATKCVPADYYDEVLTLALQVAPEYADGSPAPAEATRWEDEGVLVYRVGVLITLEALTDGTTLELETARGR